MKAAFFFNSPYLGGAERSLIYQSKMFEGEIAFYIPRLGSETYGEIHELLNECGYRNEDIHYFDYPEKLFLISRSRSFLGKALPLFFSLLKGMREVSKLELHHYDILWCNGNKIGLVVYLYAYLASLKGKFVWHFRDYPSGKFPFSFIWKSFKWKKSFPLNIVANSCSVKEELIKQGVPSSLCFVFYNPSGMKSFKKPAQKQTESYTLGFVGMFAPWKGIHQILWFAFLMEDRLRELGVESINIYGGSLYKTDGEHMNYEDELKALQKKLNVNLVKFCGFKKPQEIYSEIDLLLHTSLKPEPFGRVLLEAMEYSVPVITTGLGGALEVIGEQEQRGWCVQPYCFSDWIDRVESILKNPDECQKKLIEANQYAKTMNQTVQGQMAVILESP